MNDIDMSDVSYIDRINFYIRTTTDTSTGGDFNNIKILHNKLDIDVNNHYLSMGINGLARRKKVFMDLRILILLIL